MKTDIIPRFALIFTLLFIGLSKLALSDGLLLPENQSYPADFLRKKITEVHVTIHGLVAQTVTTMEFVNEWDQTVDAVFNFPLPQDARSTQLLYDRNDTMFKAVLRVEPQNPNPGTGQGGLAALVNSYIGPNGLKLALREIAPGATQTVILSYISLLDYHQGDCSYTYPLATEEFITYPMDHLEFIFDVEANRGINDFDIPTHPTYQVLESGYSNLKLRMRQPMAYLATDLVFNFSVENLECGVEFYSVQSDTMDGHFALFVRPENDLPAPEILNKNIVFLLGNSSNMIGYKLEQSVEAISNSLDLLSTADFFNIILFNSYVQNWQPHLVPASADNIVIAKSFLAGVTCTGGSRLDLGLAQALLQFEDADYSNAILAFTDGKSPIDPEALAASNSYQTGIFPIGIGNNIDRYRLEMTATLNYGFATYLDEEDNLREGILDVFEIVNQPILKNVALVFNKPDVYGIMPQVYPTTYAGSYFYVASRYRDAGTAVMNLIGEGVNGLTQYDYQLDFTDSTNVNKFVEKLWAKEMIDALEQQILIYGETPALKDSVISLSLRYEIRCIYTSYFADYETIYVSDDLTLANPAGLPKSFVSGNYPNPFQGSTTLRFYIDNQDLGKVKVLRIYNMQGKLVAVIDVSRFLPGWHEIPFNGTDLPAGVYLVQLQVDNKIANTIRISVIR